MFLRSFSGWLKTVKRRSTVAPAHRGGTKRSTRSRFAPQLEALEDRTVPSYVFQTIDHPNAGTTGSEFPVFNDIQGTFPGAINASGLIAGNYGDANNVTHGLLLSHGQYTTFDDPSAGTAPGQGTNAFGLNDRGQVVGFYWDADFVKHGFLLSHGHYTTLDDPNAVGSTEAFSLNDSGQIVGDYLDASSVYHGFLLSHGHYTTLDDPNAGTAPGQGTLAYGINASGKIVGLYFDASGVPHGFLLSGGRYTTIDDPNGVAGTEADNINARGQIVGSYIDAILVFHVYLLSHGHYTTLDDPNAATDAFSGTLAEGINGSGKIVGVSYDANGVGHGFLATPAHDEPRISIGDVDKKEGKKGETTLFTFTVTLSAAYDQAVTMSFATVNGTAKTSDSDYVAKTGTLTFAPGETTKTITIEVKGDSKKEANDLFGNSSNALFTKKRGIGRILNDD